jgi:hypothetical protein
MAKQLKTEDRNALVEWADYLKGIEHASQVDEDLSPVEREKKKRSLEADPVAWIRYFFPGEARYPFARFHRAFIRRVVQNPDWYEVISWARELAKSTTVRMVVLYLLLTGKIKNILLVSATQDSAIRLLKPYRGHLEANKRIIYFYGKQAGTTWKEDEIITINNAAARAIGFGNTPRGTQNDSVRPDCILVDDADTDEECRNPDTINHKWNWFEEALYFTRSFSEPLRTIWCGNIIADDCCITRAGARARELAKRKNPAGNWDIINIRMVDIHKPDPVKDYQLGTSVWPEKNTEERIDLVLSQVSSAAAQKECFNNPVQEGAVFKEITWGTVPPLNKFRFLVAYADPSPSNNTRAKANSYKSCFLVGLLDRKLYVITGFLDRVVNAGFINWFYLLDDYVDGRTAIFNMIENNKLQDPFYEQVLLPLFLEASREHGKIINISGDPRAKIDKAARIEANLEPLNARGDLVLNAREKDNPHMKRLEDQFKKFTLRLSFPADGPDCVEGAYFIAKNKIMQYEPGSIAYGKPRTNKKRY